MDAAALDRFLDGLRAGGVPESDLPALRDSAAAIARVAGDAAIQPVHVDEALRRARWQGADTAALAAIRRAGEHLVAWQRDNPPPAAVSEAAETPAAEPAPEPDVEPFDWATTALQVCLVVAVLMAVSRAVSVVPSGPRKSPQEIAMDDFVRRTREEEVIAAAAQRAAAAPPRPAVPRKEQVPAAMDAFRSAQQASGSGRDDEARRELTRAIAFDPSFKEAYHELAAVNLRLARNAARNGERSEALSYFRDVVSDRRRASQLSTMGSPAMAYRRSHTDQSLADLERLERDDAAALAWLGYRPVRTTGPQRARRYPAAPSYALPAVEPRLPGPTRVGPSVVTPSEVQPSEIRPSYLDGD